MDKEGLGFQVRASPATWILQKTSSVRSFRKNEANCVIVVPDCRGTQFRKGDGQPMCLAQEAHQLPETPIRTESSINLGN